MKSFPTQQTKETTWLYINEPCVEMRENPSIQSKVVSQAVFSEKVNLTKEEKGWSYISTPDEYQGWIPSHAIVKRDKPYETSFRISRLNAHVYQFNNIEYGPIKTLPYGSQLQALDTIDARWIKIAFPCGREYYIQKGDVALEKTPQNKYELIALSQRFLGLPYTWGGRSSFGFDCSGFIQMLYQQIGIQLQRDSHQQVLDARFKTIELNCLEPGDLLFFGKSNKKIMHVGMYVGEERFIHTSSRENQPWLRVSRLSDIEWSGNPDAYYPCRIARQLF